MIYCGGSSHNCCVAKFPCAITSRQMIDNVLNCSIVDQLHDLSFYFGLFSNTLLTKFCEYELQSFNCLMTWHYYDKYSHYSRLLYVYIHVLFYRKIYFEHNIDLNEFNVKLLQYFIVWREYFFFFFLKADYF